MAAAYTPEWWLVRLSEELSDRQDRIELLRSYADGNGPLPEGAAGMREAYRAFQRKARTNFGSLIVEAVRERMTPAGFRATDAEMDAEANRIWQANQLDVFAGDVHQDMLTVGYGYVLVNGPIQRSGFWGTIDKLFGQPSAGTPVITREDPALMITAHDPLQPQRVVAALKVFHDDVEEKDYAYLYLPGVCYVAEKSAKRGASADISASGYKIVETRKLPAGFEDVVPVVCFQNNDGKGEYEAHTDVIDRIAYVVLQRLVILAIQAFRQRALKEGEEALPEYEMDADGNPVLDSDGQPIPVDYTAIFKPGPGALWVLPQGMDLWESQPTDIQPILTAAKDDVRTLAAVTRTPMSTLMPEGENQSAEGATFAREGLVFKTKDRIKRASYGWNEAMGLALRFAGQSAEIPAIEWEQVELRTLAEKADAASKAQDWPYRTRLTEIWGFAPDKADRMERERVNDALMGQVAGTNAK